MIQIWNMPRVVSARLQRASDCSNYGHVNLSSYSGEQNEPGARVKERAVRSTHTRTTRYI